MHRSSNTEGKSSAKKDATVHKAEAANSAQNTPLFTPLICRTERDTKMPATQRAAEILTSAKVKMRMMLLAK